MIPGGTAASGRARATHAWLVRNTLGRLVPELADHGRPAVDRAWLAEVVGTAQPDLLSALDALAGPSDAVAGGPTVVAVARGSEAARVLARMTRPRWAMRMQPSLRSPDGVLDPFCLTPVGHGLVADLLRGREATGR